MNNTHDLSKAELDHIMSGIGIYEYHLQEEFNDWVGITNRKRIPADFYCQLDRSLWIDDHKGASNYLINVEFVDKKSNPPGPVIKNTIKNKRSQVLFSPHSIQRFIQRGNSMPKLRDLYLRLPACWHPSDNLRGVSNILLPVKNGVFIGNVHWGPGLLTDIHRWHSKKQYHYIESQEPLINKKTGEFYLSEGNLPHHHTVIPGYGFRHMAYHAVTYIDYDQMHPNQRLIYDTHFYDPVASWDLQLSDHNKTYYSKDTQARFSLNERTGERPPVS